MSHFFNITLFAPFIPFVPYLPFAPECDPPYRPSFVAKSTSSFGKSNSSLLSKTKHVWASTLRRLWRNKEGGKTCFYSVIEGINGTRTSRGTWIQFDSRFDVQVNASFVEIFCGEGESEFVSIPYRAANLAREKDEIKRKLKRSRSGMLGCGNC